MTATQLKSQPLMLVILLAGILGIASLSAQDGAIEEPKAGGNLPASDRTGLATGLGRLKTSSAAMTAAIRARKQETVTKKLQEQTRRLNELTEAQEFLLKLFPPAVGSGEPEYDSYKGIAIVQLVRHGGSKDEAIRVIDNADSVAKGVVNSMIRAEMNDPQNRERIANGQLPKASHSRNLAIGLGILGPEFDPDLEVNR